MHRRAARPSSGSWTEHTPHETSAGPARLTAVGVVLSVALLGAPALQAQPIPDLEGGTAVVVTGAHGAADACGLLFSVRRLSAVELPDSIADFGEIFLCVPGDLRAWRPAASGDSTRYEPVDVEVIEVGMELDVWTRGLTLPTNPPRLRADRIRIRPRAEPDADPMES